MILCWVDAGPAFGLGHVSRTLALAEALAARGHACRFALVPDATASTWLASAGMPPALPLASDGSSLPQVLEAARTAQAVIVDVRHPLTRQEVRALAANGRRVLVIDNAGPGVADADLVLAPFATAEDAHWLCGARYVPLRPAYRTKPVAATGDPPVVLVSMGATDPGGLTIPALAAVSRMRPPRPEVHVVANPSAPVWTKLPDLLQALGAPPAFPVDPRGLRARLLRAQVAILAMGVTVYEAMACGVPAVVLCRTDGDVEHASGLERAGAIVSLGIHWRQERITAVLEALLAEPSRRTAMGRAGRALVDGEGAERVAERCVALLGGVGRMNDECQRRTA